MSIGNRYTTPKFSLSIDTRSLACFRIALGLIIATDMLLRLADVRAHYSDDGLWPRAEAFKQIGATPWLWSFQLLDGSVFFNALMLLLTCASGFWLAVGWRTRLALPCCLLLVTSVQNRLPGVNMGADTLISVLLFWSLFLPGMAWRQARLRSPGHTITGWPSRALLLQICLMYWATALFKSDPVWREEGSAVQLAIAIESFQKPLAASALQFPSFLQFLTAATLWLEELGPIIALLGNRYWIARTLAVFAFQFFHLAGIGLTMRLGIFPWTCGAAWLLFLPGPFWDWLASKLGATLRVPRTTNSQFPTPKELRSSYFDLCSPVLVCVFLFYIVWWNAATLYPTWLSKSFPASFKIPGHWIGLSQNWQFFAPRPATRDGWYVGRAVLEDGRIVDPLHGGVPVSWEHPRSGIASEFKNARWHKHLHGMFLVRSGPFIRAYAEYAVREWNNNHTTKVRSFELFYMLRDHYHPEDGTRRVKVYPFNDEGSKGGIHFEGDLRWEQEQEAAGKKAQQ
ncbi:HTTM domain-containing protein [Roseimicrobium sp. ORNL1]|uniref:HTTM domain-containing protein n=1 Tax=Roseimicrobium sp. ORNL1 TaxID=2711231 RepID=UPI00197CFB1F|nr:HTTM domain-containing protein [Roseimicrobium sp. ORNL1]